MRHVLAAMLIVAPSLALAQTPGEVARLLWGNAGAVRATDEAPGGAVFADGAATPLGLARLSASAENGSVTRSPAHAFAMEPGPTGGDLVRLLGPSAPVVIVRETGVRETGVRQAGVRPVGPRG